MTVVEVGCNLSLDAAVPTAVVLLVAPRLDEPSTCVLDEHGLGEHESGEPETFLDLYRNRCRRMVLPAGVTDIDFRARVRVSSLPDPVELDAPEIPPAQLPGDALVYTMPSRYCLSDELAGEALQRFGHLAPGWARVQAIVDDVHGHLVFEYGSTSSVSTAVDVFHAGRGVCRDFTHLAITYCRALNIPARYVMGYIPDIGVVAPDAPMDFCAWMEVFLGGHWHTFDPRLNERRIGRVVVARGRDAVDVAILTSYGPVGLARFDVVADEVAAPEAVDVV